MHTPLKVYFFEYIFFQVNVVFCRGDFVVNFVSFVSFRFVVVSFRLFRCDVD